MGGDRLLTRGIRRGRGRGRRGAGAASPGGRSSTSLALTLRNSRWQSMSQVKPTPPCTWMFSPVIRRRPRPRSPWRCAAARLALGVVDVGWPTPRSAWPTRASSSWWSMSTILCWITWNVAIGRSNCTRALAYSVAICEGPLAGADALRAQGDADVVDRPGARSARWSPGGPTRRAGRSVEHEPGHLAGDVHGSAPASPRGRVDERRRPRPSCVARHDVGDVGGVAVEHERLVPVEHPVVAPSPGRCARCRRAGRACPLSSRATVARRRARRRGRRAPASSPRRRASERARDRRGEPRAGQRERAHLLAEHHRVEQPEPGAAVLLGDEQARPARGRRTWPRASSVTPRSSSSIARTYAAAPRRRGTRAPCSRSASCSALNVKSMRRRSLGDADC